MNPLQNIQRLGWLLLLWFTVVGLGMVGGFVEFARRIPPPPVALAMATPTPIYEPALKIDNQLPPPNYSAREVWILERTTGSVLYADRSQEATAVASLAKLMTALVAYENYDLQSELPIGRAAGVVGNRAKFLSRDRFSVADLLRAMLVFSANDAAQALANGLGESDEPFIGLMNHTAADLGLRNTHFVNSFGLDDPLQYSSAEDIGQLADSVLSVPFLEDIVSQEKVVVKERQTGRLDTIYTTNSLLKLGPQYRGVKTGTTEQAGESLVVRYVTEGENGAEPLDLLLVILGSQDRFTEAKSLVNWILQAVRPAARFAAFSGQ